MIIFYKKVFLTCLGLRFSIMPLLAAAGPALAAGAGSAGQGLMSGLFSMFSGGSKSQKPNAFIDAHRAKQNVDALQTATSSPSPQRMMREASEKAAEFGNNMLGQFVEQFADRGINKVIDSMFTDKFDPIKAGMQQRAFHAAAFPGVNPWEMAGSSGATGPQVVAEQQRRSASQVANKTTAATRGAAETTASPQLKKVEFESAANVAEKTASAKLKEAQADVTDTEGMIRKVDAHWQPYMKQLSFAQKSLENAKTSSETTKALASANLIRKQAITEVQKAGKTKADKEIAQTYAKILKPIKDIEGLSDLFLAIGTFSAAGIGRNLRSIIDRPRSRLKSKGITSNTDKMSPSEWRQWRMDTGRVNKQTGELYP